VVVKDPFPEVGSSPSDLKNLRSPQGGGRWELFLRGINAIGGLGGTQETYEKLRVSHILFDFKEFNTLNCPESGQVGGTKVAKWPEKGPSHL